MGMPDPTDEEQTKAWNRYFDTLITSGNKGFHSRSIPEMLDDSAVAVAQPSAPRPDASAPHEPLVSPAVTQDSVHHWCDNG